MLRATECLLLIALLSIVSGAPHSYRGSRKGMMSAIYGQRHVGLVASFENAMIEDIQVVEKEASSTTPLVLLFIVLVTSLAGAVALMEHRRKHSNSSWMADQRSLALYRGLIVISMAQGMLAVYKIYLGDLWQGGLDGINAAIGYYATQPNSMSFLKAYLILSGITTVVDVLGLLMDGIICIDMARPALCIAGIYFAREFLVEAKSYVSKCDGLLGASKDSPSNVIDRLLSTAVSSSLVQQAMIVLGVVDLDPLLFGQSQKMPGGDENHMRRTESADVFAEQQQTCFAEQHRRVCGEGTVSPASDPSQDKSLDLLAPAVEAETKYSKSEMETQPIILVPGSPNDLLEMCTEEFASDDHADLI
jgi:hypothetical protein